MLITLKYEAQGFLPWRLIQQIVIFFLLLLKNTPAGEELGTEFCRWEAFNVTCPADAVIVIRSAFYGRMRKGRCLETDYYIGCSKDVLFWVDDRCSGRRHCSVAVPNPELHEIQPCPKDFQTYLQADYQCTIVQTSNTVCHQQPLLVSQELDEGYLSSSITDVTSQGSTPCPWLVRVEKGQKINVTLFDFSIIRNMEPDDTFCHTYAIIKEKGQRDETVCGGKSRQRRLCTSFSNELQIVIVKQTVEKLRRRFLIKYQAVGCQDPLVSEFSWIERLDDRLTIGCNCTEQTWHLVCKGTKWVGDVGRCQPCQDFSKSDTIYPYGLLFSIVIGIVLGIVLGVCLLALLITCRRRRALNEEIPQYYVERAQLEKQANFVGTPVQVREPSSAAGTGGYSGFVNPGHPSNDQHGSLRLSSYAHIRDPLQKPLSFRGRLDRDALAADTARLTQSGQPPVAGAGAAAGVGPCCGGSAARMGLTFGRLYDSPVLEDSGQQSKASTASYSSDIPVYNEVATPE